jgi:putative transposase
VHWIRFFEQIDAGEMPLGGDDGLLKGMLKAALERGLEVELTDHVGYGRGDPEASLFPNSRNGTSSKTVSSEVGDLELAVPRDRNGSFTPRLVPKGSRRLGGLDEMIISLYAGGMTLRDIQHHLASTIGTELSYETISKITDQVAEEVLAWQRRPLEAWRIPLVVANPGVKGFGCPGTHITRCRWRLSGATSS